VFKLGPWDILQLVWFGVERSKVKVRVRVNSMGSNSEYLQVTKIASGGVGLLSVCEHDYSNSFEPICMKLDGWIRLGSETNRIDLGLIQLWT